MSDQWRRMSSDSQVTGSKDTKRRAFLFVSLTTENAPTRKDKNKFNNTSNKYFGDLHDFEEKTVVG